MSGMLAVVEIKYECNCNLPWLNNLFEGCRHVCFHVHQSASALYTVLAFIFKPDVARLALVYNINYSLRIVTICFPLRRQLLYPWPASHPRSKGAFFSPVPSEGPSGTSCVCVFGGRWLIVSLQGVFIVLWRVHDAFPKGMRKWCCWIKQLLWMPERKASLGLINRHFGWNHAASGSVSCKESQVLMCIVPGLL